MFAGPGLRIAWTAALSFFALSLLALSLLATGCRDTTLDAPRRPNIVLVVVDTLRADHLEDYGYPQPTAPALRRFGRHSTRFTDCTAPASWTAPSIASLFTGLLPTRHRVSAHGVRLPDGAKTLAESLREGGWHTAGISFNAEIARVTGFAQGFDDFDDHLGKVLTYPDASEMVERVGRWLDGRPATEAADARAEPFFLYLQVMNTHGPYRVPEAHRADLLGRPPSAGFRYRSGPMKAILLRGDIDRRAEVTPRYVTSLVEQYDTAIRYTTDRVSELFGLLAERGLYDEALVIVTSDHGEELFDHGGFSHGYSLHREVLHVPLYVKRPGQQQSHVVSAPVSLQDVHATVLELAGLGGDEATDSRSLVPLLDGADPSEPLPRWSEAAWEERCVARAVELDGHKLIEIESSYEGLEDEVRLYDVRSDPRENRDLSALQPDRVARLRATLREGFSVERGSRLDDPVQVLDQLDRDRLEALGYIDEP